ncbi:MAG: CDP-glucose 4,6-dehydratase [bacterium]
MTNFPFGNLHSQIAWILPIREQWAGRRVLVTGHTGFKGSWLVRWLSRAGAQVSGFSLEEPVSDPALFALADLAPTLHASLTGDIRDASTVARVVRELQPEVIFHLAAQPLVRASYRTPIDTWMTNAMGTAYLLEAVRPVPAVRAVVVCTTDKCYENMTPGHPPFREGDPLGGFDPYSSSKAGAEIVASAWRRSFFADSGAAAIGTVRAGNVVGGGDFAEDRLIPDLIRHWRAGTTTPIRNPDATRPWQHVLEPLSGYIRLAERLLADGARYAESWNFGPELADIQPVHWVTVRLLEALPGARWELERAPQPHEASTLSLDWGKANAQLDWAPRWDLATTLARTAAWYRGWAEAESATGTTQERAARIRALIDDDITTYEAQPEARQVGARPSGEQR